jgi:hypothetical protein
LKAEVLIADGMPASLQRYGARKFRCGLFLQMRFIGVADGASSRSCILHGVTLSGDRSGNVATRAFAQMPYAVDKSLATG